MLMSLRKLASDMAASPWELFTLVAPSSNVGSWLTPASKVIGSYFVLPGIWCGPLESPPSYQGVTSVVRLRALHLFSPATYWPSHLILNLNPRYGSNLVVLTVNLAIGRSPFGRPRRYPDANPAFWLILTTTNSAGFSGAKPTKTLTTPASMSVWAVVSPSHLTKKACDGVEPWKAPCRNSVIMNAPMLRRSCAHSGSSFGSNTANWM